MKKEVLIGLGDLGLEDFVAVARHGAKVRISEESIGKVEKSRETVRSFIDRGSIVYGVTTGFGKFSEVCVTKEQAMLMQRNLIVSHAVGSGDFFDEDVTRGIMLLRINSLCIGYSGVRYKIIATLVDMLNKGVHPLIPEK
nr:aromatic amino acid lyase [Clostridia bacterium]